MKNIKRTISLILSIVLIALSAWPNIVFAKEKQDKFSISINTDKEEYSIKDSAHIIVKVTNVSDYSVGGVVVNCVSNELLLKQKRSAFLEIGELSPGENCSLEFDVVLNRKNSNLGFFEKLILFFTQLFSKTYSFEYYSPESNKSFEKKNKSIKFDGAQVTLSAEAWFSSFSEEELKEMNSVDKSLAESDDIEDSLYALQNDGLISNISKKLGFFEFSYSNGVNGGVASDKFSDSIDENYESELPSQYFIEEKVKRSYSECSISKALLLYSFNYPSDDQQYRRYFYDGKDQSSCVNTFGKKQMSVDIDDSVTVNDVKNINGLYDVVCFCGHGSMYKNSPVMCLTEKVTDDNKKNYADDLLNNRIAIVQYDGDAYYWVFPELFDNCYQNNELDDKVIFMQCCEAFGEKNEYDYSFSDAFIKSGSSAVIGFHNEVNSSYGRNFMKTFVTSYAEGNTVGDSYNSANRIDSQKYSGNIGVPVITGNVNQKIDDYSTVNINVINRSGNSVGTYKVKYTTGSIISMESTEKSLSVLYDIDADLTQNINAVSSKGETYYVTATL